MSLLLIALLIGELSRVLAKELEKPRHSVVDIGDKDYYPVVTLRGSGSKSPIFLVQSGGGESLIWLSMLQDLPDRPMYPFRIRGFRSWDTVFASFNGISDCYKAAVLRV